MNVESMLNQQCVPAGKASERTRAIQLHAHAFHECEGGIEKSIPRIAVWHHEACGVMTNGDPKGWISLSYPHTNNGFFSCSLLYMYILFILK